MSKFISRDYENECNCVKICDEICLNFLSKVVCQENICRAELCNNSFRPLKMDAFEIKKFEKKGFGLEAKQVINK